MGLGHELGYNQVMNALSQARPTIPVTRRPGSLHRFVLAWAVMVGGLVGFWCSRPWLGKTAFNFGQFAVLIADVEDRLAALPAAPGVGAVHASEVSGLLRLVRHAAAAVSRGRAHRRRCPDSHTWPGSFLNAVTGAVLLWLVPRLLPVGTPWAIRFWIALSAFASCA